MDIGSIVASGMQALRTKADAHAHNVANARTPGYKRLDARTVERSEGGVDLSIERDPGSERVTRRDEEDSATLSADGRSSAGPSAPVEEESSAIVPDDFTSEALPPSDVDPVEEMVGMKEAAAGMEMLAAAYERDLEAKGTLFEAFG